MSRFKIDFVKPESDIFMDRIDTTIKAEVDESLPSIGIVEFLDSISKFSRSLSPEDQSLYEMARIASKTTKNNKNSAHIWVMLSDFFLNSLSKTYPDKDFSDIKSKVNDVDISILEKEDVDNRVFVVYLIGLLEGLL